MISGMTFKISSFLKIPNYKQYLNLHQQNLVIDLVWNFGY